MISRLKQAVKAKAPVISTLLKAAGHFVKGQVSRRNIGRLLRRKREIFLEVGAGDKRGKNNWLTIDMTKNCDIFWDLRKGLPFPDECISKIYSSHFLEHLSFKEGQQFLAECKRALVPRGTFSISVPNARIYIEAYMKSGTLDENRFIVYKPAYNNTTRIDYVNYMAYMDGHHKYMFDEENLLYILRAAGFRNVRLRQFDPELDLEERDFESIYAEAVK